MTTRLLRGNRFKLALSFILLFGGSLLYFIVQNQYQIRNAVSYATRPLWDKADGPKEIIPHFYAEGLPMDAHTCRLHGWEKRNEGTSLTMLDAILMSSELDLLEIRMEELDPVVDHFFIIESNATFTGLPKDTYYASNQARFSKFKKKIVYRFVPGYPLRDGQSAWDVEAHTRDTMTRLLRQHIQALPQGTKPLVLMSDVDEIPSRHTIALLKACDFGAPLHLQLRNFLYSFEWYIGPSSWRASVRQWNSESFYRHSMSSNRMLADAGWHCSYCFRTLSEYITKMQGFSHSDRIGGRQDLLQPKRIQEIICKGKDLFDMLPEAYSYLDFFSQLSLEPIKSAVGLPRYALEHAETFRFLLPGGCLR